MPNVHDPDRIPTGFRIHRVTKASASERAKQDPAAGNLNAAVERLLEGYAAGTIVLPQPAAEPAPVPS